MEPIWKDQTVSLYCPLTRDNGEQHDTLTLTMIDNGQHIALVDEYQPSQKDDKPKENHEFYSALVALSAGLSDKEMDRLVSVDFNTLKEQVDYMFGEDSRYWFDKLVWGGLSGKKYKEAEQAFDQLNQLPLLVPVDTVVHGKVDKLPLTLPTVGVLGKWHQITDEDDSQQFILQHVSGLDKQELESLSVPDAASLSKRISDFLSKTGTSYSARKTLKS
ncbi:MAG: hypothetical protein OIF57_15955 [Marinobacterium sp.]|nr:hypothetical protein [Marinobacterium sp.]